MRRLTLVLTTAADADRSLVVAGRKVVEARAILVAPREMGEQRADGGQPETLELPLPLRRDPVELRQRRFEIHGRESSCSPQTGKIFARDD